MTVRIGIIGIGFMGMTHFEGAKQLSGGKVTAIATRSEKKRGGDWSNIQGNFGPRGSESVDLSGIATYADYHELLSDDNVDLVDICLPTDQHEKVTIEALKRKGGTLQFQGEDITEFPAFPMNKVGNKYITIKAARGHNYESCELGLKQLNYLCS